jgi:hypothetical protein
VIVTARPGTGGAVQTNVIDADEAAGQTRVDDDTEPWPGDTVIVICDPQVGTGLGVTVTVTISFTAAYVLAQTLMQPVPQLGKPGARREITESDGAAKMAISGPDTVYVHVTDVGAMTGAVKTNVRDAVEAAGKATEDGLRTAPALHATFRVTPAAVGPEGVTVMVIGVPIVTEAGNPATANEYEETTVMEEETGTLK